MALNCETFPIYNWDRETAEHYLRNYSFEKSANDLPPMFFRRCIIPKDNPDLICALSWKTKYGCVRHCLIYMTSNGKFIPHMKSDRSYPTLKNLVKSFGCTVYKKEEIEKTINDVNNLECTEVYWKPKEPISYWRWEYLFPASHLIYWDQID